MNTPKERKRLHVVDAIRGFAIVSIMLLHNLEHFDMIVLPENLPAWIQSLDKMVWDVLFFLFAGKSYAMFALLFGLTFYIQTHNQEKIGQDFRLRFAWRLVLLFLFGLINSAFYQGDILTIYAMVGLFIIPVAKLSNRLLLVIALILLLQPIEMYAMFKALQNPDIKLPNPESWAYFGKMGEYIKGDSLLDTIYGNLTNGKKAVLLWSNENGRFLHILALFILGLLAGRKKLFVWSEQSKRFWKRTLFIASIAFIPLHLVRMNLENIISSEAVRRSAHTIEASWSNLAFMLVLVALFMLAFHASKLGRVLNIFAPMGRMSLSNYVMQSILGSSIYYGFGLGLYQYTGATYSLLIGLVLAIFMSYFSSWWMKNNKRGPLETIWHKATWAFSTNK